MPGMDGYQLIREIRKRQDAAGERKIYAIALTGFTSLGERDEALAAGFDAHFGKPANIDKIAPQLASGVRARAAAAG
jgi:two-component system CheB/CheR fusion protein